MTFCQPALTDFNANLPTKPAEEPSTGGLNGRNITKKSRCCLIVLVKKILALFKAVVMFPVRIFKRKAKDTKDETSSKIETFAKKTETLPNPSITPTAQPVSVKQLTPEQIEQENKRVDKLNSNKFIKPTWSIEDWAEFLNRQGARLKKFVFSKASLKEANRCLEKCPNVTEVNILAKANSDEVINLKPILTKLKLLRVLCLSFRDVFYNKDTPHLAEALRSLQKLERLEIGSVREKGGLQSIIAALSCLRDLKALSFRDSALSLKEADDLHRQILSLPNLTSLEFERISIDEKSIDKLFQGLEISSIRRFTFSESKHVDQVVLALMKQPLFLKNLQYLDLSAREVSLDSISLIVQHFKDMPNLISLDLDGCFSFEEDDEYEYELSETEEAKRKAELKVRRMISERKGDLPKLVNLNL